jgi:toxin ParE1/3/4
MKSFVLTPAAIRDLHSIQSFIAGESPQAARKVLTALRAAIRKLARQPGIGHRREDLADPRYRFFLVYSYFIVYAAESKPLRVIRILHAARDLQTMLRPRPEEV